ncbi:IclR family transcriptional regulator [Amycolatopsis sp. CA-230715]|uniref:IclR family transcriptional regulator n=1 Tax=Amycolatopsis sp. CA-230715 TaxID=2745196 RepID=UPI001C00E82A|nr:IclR family transcriptional regulator [Amycolatopsis sp. CA-230715]QWF84940.1 hypothetical protein HUW46_08392 [Amycolatopsis sp. CA-230715]
MPRQPSKPPRGAVDEARPASANYHANALARGLALLELIAAQGKPLTLSEFSDGTALPKSTLVRLVAVLTELDYLVRVDDRPSYRLGHKVQGLATAYLATLDLSTAASPHLLPVAEQTGQTANLGMIDGDQVLHACVAEPDRPLRFTTATGARDHLYCTGLGKLLLAQLDSELVAACLPVQPWPAFTESTHTTLEPLHRELLAIAGRGYALDDNERSAGLRCVAVPVPVRGETGESFAAISVSGPTGEFAPAQQQAYVARLRQAAADLAADPEVAAALRLAQRSLRPPGRAE